ncbi:hypothetical protein EFN35_06850 [Pediococcus parvulus]|nr:hypothetical protein [Pediococcus parvulus]
MYKNSVLTNFIHFQVPKFSHFFIIFRLKIFTKNEAATKHSFAGLVYIFSHKLFLKSEKSQILLLSLDCAQNLTAFSSLFFKLIYFVD